MVFRRVFPSSFCALAGILLIGCGSSGPGTPIHPPTTALQPSGSVHGGQQPVAGATIQLYTAGTTGDGSAATPLLTTAVTSDSNGNFSITGLYSCTNASEVYIVATGGNPGLSAANPNIALMAALGPCSALTSSTFITINELTTVAAIAALAPYMSSAAAIGSSSSDATQLANAFTAANELVSTATGFSPGNVPSGYTVPTNQLNTLADILSACINSPGGTAGDGSLCGQLFALTTVGSNAAPTNTIQAMLNLADNPTLNTSALYALTPPTPPVQPTLPSAPTDFSVSLQGASSLQADVSAINFQDVTVGSSAPLRKITLRNYNQLGNITIVGEDPGDFSLVDAVPVQTGNCQMGSGSPCWLQVEARPSVPGIRNAAIAIDYNYHYTLYIPLSVTGVPAAPNSVLSASIVNFPPTIAGTSSTPIPITLSNSGPLAINVSSVAISGATNNNFTQTNNCSSIAVNANCTIYVTFAPTSSGLQSASLQVTSDASGSGTVSLSGNGLSLGTAPSLWPSYLAFTIWGANEDLTLINSGTTAASVSNLGAGDAGGEGDQHSYAVTGNGCTSTLAAGQACTASIQNVLMLNLNTSSIPPLPNGVCSGRPSSRSIPIR